MLLFHFLQKLNVKFELEENAIGVLVSYNWPGNVRELKNLAERISVMHTGNRIGGQSIIDLLLKNPGDFGNHANLSQKDGQNRLPSNIVELSYNEAKEAFEKMYLEYQLAKNGDVISRTAEAIGIYPSNLHAKLRKYGITIAGSGHGERTER
jgi:two-component system nitrogen regulation response regulator NtrX